MSFILTSQAASDLPYSYQNNFSNTLEIKPRSKIALNHATINRNAMFNFDQDKVLCIYHGAVVPSGTDYDPIDDPNTSVYVRQNYSNYEIYDKEEIRPFGNIVMTTVIPAGSYSVDELASRLEFQLNNPNAEYGGDFMVSGGWDVTAVRTGGEFQRFQFDWSGAQGTNNETAVSLTSAQIKSVDGSSLSDMTVTTAVPATTITSAGSGNKWTVAALGQRFLSQSAGTYTFDLTETIKTGEYDSVVIGLTRIAPNETLENDILSFEPKHTGQHSIHPYSAIGADNQSEGGNEQYWFFDYCVHLVYVSNEWELRVYESLCIQDLDNSRTNELLWEMNEIDIPDGTYTKPSEGKAYDITFKIDGEKVSIFTKHVADASEKLLVDTLKPICTNNFQMVQKVCFEDKGMSIKLNKSVYVDANRAPVLREGANATRVNTFYSAAYYNNDRGHFNTNFKNVAERSIAWKYTTADFETMQIKRFMSVDLNTEGPITKATSWQVEDLEGVFKYNISRWAQDPQQDDGLVYRYLTAPSGNNARVVYPSTALIGYRSTDVLPAHGSLGAALGLQKPIHSSFDYVTDPNAPGTSETMARLIGSSNITLIANNDLYVRIDLGSTKSVNGVTGSVSRIVSPILTNISQSSGVSGIRHYIPTERMYLDLNNANSLFINSIRVEFVTESERYAVELSPTTSASFHII